MLLIKSSAFFSMQLYKGMFRYTGLTDLWRLFKAVGVSFLLLLSGIVIVHGFTGYSRSVFVIDAVLTLLFTGGLRLLIRFMFTELRLHRSDSRVLRLFKDTGDHKVILIYGAGSAGEKLFREITETNGANGQRGLTPLSYYFY